MRQGSFSQAEYAGKKKQTRRDRFLGEMEQVVPWARLVERLRPLYPKGERGRPPIGLDRMLRIYFLQQWYGLADEELEDALYDSQALRGFAGIDLAVESVPDARTLLKFRHWLERHDLTRVLFEEVGAMLEERGLLMRQSLPRRRPGARSSMRPESNAPPGFAGRGLRVEDRAASPGLRWNNTPIRRSHRKRHNNACPCLQQTPRNQPRAAQYSPNLDRWRFQPHANWICGIARVPLYGERRPARPPKQSLAIPPAADRSA
jgi:hypothetical protein